ncbi:MAG: head maturation protease, ClpP-related [Pseudomonadota bacterium]
MDDTKVLGWLAQRLRPLMAAPEMDVSESGLQGADEPEAAPAETNITLYGPVGFVEDDDDMSGITAAKLRAGLPDDGAPIMLRVNSPGGSASEGAAMHAVLREYAGTVRVRVEGAAYSAASLFIMAAEEIVMAEGAVMMIHDPATITLGNEGDHLRSVAMLNTLAEEYAAVYAARMGITTVEAREMMKRETWAGGREAVRLGLADRAEGASDDIPMAASVIPFPYEQYARAPADLVAMARAKGWARPSRSAQAVATAATKEVQMDAKTSAAETPLDVTPEAVEMKADPPQQDVQSALAAERRRAAEIRKAGEAAQMDGVMIDRMIDSGATLAHAKSVFLDAWIAADPTKGVVSTPPPNQRMQMGRDEGETRVEAIIGALHATMTGKAPEGPSTQYRGMTLKRLAAHLAGRQDFVTSNADHIRAGMTARGVIMAGGQHSTSDFGFLTTALMNRAMRDAYEARPGTWRQISRQRTAADFRPLYSVQAGLDTEMRKVNEAGEYESTVMIDSGEQYRIIRYGREIALTFEAIITDDMGGFNRIPGDFARGALNLESRTCWDLINTNPNYSDGNAVFSAPHANLGTPGAISVATVGEAFELMYQQRPLGADPEGYDFIAAQPDLMYVPPALLTVARQFVSQTTPDSDGNTNPYKNDITVVPEPRLGLKVAGGSDTAFYLFDSQLPTLEHAFLSGYEAPSVVSEEGINPKGLKMTAEHNFGAVIAEFRGAFKNAGA